MPDDPRLGETARRHRIPHDEERRRPRLAADYAKQSRRSTPEDLLLDQLREATDIARETP